MIIYIFQVVDGFKNNEEQLKKYVEEYKLKLSKSVIYFTIHFTNYMVSLDRGIYFGELKGGLGRMHDQEESGEMETLQNCVF